MTRNYSKFGKNGRRNFSMGGPTDEELRSIPNDQISDVDKSIIDAHLSSTADKALGPKAGRVSGIACFSESYLPTPRKIMEMKEDHQTQLMLRRKAMGLAKGGLVTKKGSKR